MKYRFITDHKRKGSSLFINSFNYPRYLPAKLRVTVQAASKTANRTRYTPIDLKRAPPYFGCGCDGLRSFRCVNKLRLSCEGGVFVVAYCYIADLCAAARGSS